MNNRAMIEKIAKCLALAGSDNPNEAASALRHAQKLMAEHGIDEQDVRLAGVSAKRATAGKWKNPPRHIAMLAGLVGEAFRCRPVFCVSDTRINLMNFTRRHVSSVRFIGVDPEPTLAAYAFGVLRRQLVAGRKRYLTSLSRRMKRSTKTRRADLWADGWALAVWDKIAKLAIAKEREELIDDYIKACHGALVKGQSRCHEPKGMRENGCIDQGYIDGLDVELHHGVGRQIRPQIK